MFFWNSLFQNRPLLGLLTEGKDEIVWVSLVAQRLKHLPSMWETWIQSLGWKDPLEKERATHSSILAWKIPWTEEPGGLHSTGQQRDTTERLHWNCHGTSGCVMSPVDCGSRSSFVQSWSLLILMGLCCVLALCHSFKKCALPLSLPLHYLFASLVAQTVKNLLAIQATWVQSLGWEDPLEKKMATHSSILAWRIP